MYQLAYNLICLLMGEAARKHGGQVRRLSFAGTQQRLLALWPYWDRCHEVSQHRRLADWLLEQIAADPPSADPPAPTASNPAASNADPKTTAASRVPAQKPGGEPIVPLLSYMPFGTATVLGQCLGEPRAVRE